MVNGESIHIMLTALSYISSHHALSQHTPPTHSIPYIHANIPTALGHEKSEDPLYALQNSIPIDYMHYLRHQVEMPMTRVLEVVTTLDRVKDCFYGDHVNVASGSGRKVGGGGVGIGKFFKVEEGGKCVGCGKGVGGGWEVCGECLDKVCLGGMTTLSNANFFILF